ncbi:MAG: hypothetical protein KatS3mg003_0093 [Candidatus Nitrosocaldaceae archaeon]|nr:MAG: hypothetical protein KatS3mg003_0093 [Candidatus Nitrosocaldaceae archaeon]
MSSEKQEIWVLGSKGHGADKEIDWLLDELPNFADFDTIIIDTHKIKHVFEHADKKIFIDRLEKIRNGIYERATTNGKIYLLTSKKITLEYKSKNIDILNYFLEKFDIKLNYFNKPIKNLIKVYEPYFDRQVFFYIESIKEAYAYIKALPEKDLDRKHPFIRELLKSKDDKIVALEIGVKHADICILPFIKEGEEDDSIKLLLERLYLSDDINLDLYWNSAFLDREYILNLSRKYNCSVENIQERIDKLRKLNLLESSTLTELQNKDIDELLNMEENSQLEFKSRLVWNSYSNKKDENIINDILKTIVAFLNTDGGILLIGVDNNKEVIGIEDDINCLGSFDDLDKYLINKVSSKIDKRYVSAVDMNKIKYKDKTIAKVIVKPSKKPVYYRQDDDFWF